MNTVRDVVTVLACDGATVVSILGALPTHILDALVIGPCEVCDGTGDAHYRDNPPMHLPSCDTCPACGGKGKSFVVGKDAWAAFGDVLGAELREALDLPEGEMSQLIDAVASRCARALLGGPVYETTEVVEYASSRFYDVVRDGDRIAVLKHGGE